MYRYWKIFRTVERALLEDIISDDENESSSKIICREKNVDIPQVMVLMSEDDSESVSEDDRTPVTTRPITTTWRER